METLGPRFGSRFFAGLVVVGIIALVCGLHFWNIGAAPRGFFIDESAIAYNAECIARTGADEYGIRWPIFFRSFDTYTDPVAVYSAVLPLWLFGLEPWSARVSSGFYWLILAVASYCLLRQWRFGRCLALAASFVLTIIPWVFPVSRNGSFAGHLAALVGLAAGLLFTDAALRKRSAWRAVLAGLAWAFACYAHQSARPVLILLLAGSGVVLWRPLVRRWRVLLVVAITSLVCLLPMLISVLRVPEGLTARFQQVGLIKSAASRGDLAISVAQRYFDYFSPAFLFFAGDENLRHHTGHGGELYWGLLPLLLMGGYVVIRDWRQQPRYRIVFVGLLAAPISAALTVDRMHSTRAIYGVIFWLLLAAVGARALWRERQAGRLLLLLASVVVALESTVYLVDYFGDYQRRCRGAYETELTEALRYCFGNLRTNETLSISKSAISALALNQNFNPPAAQLAQLEVTEDFKPYIYAHILFFGRIDPLLYQQTGIPSARVRLVDGSRPAPGLLLRSNRLVAFSRERHQYVTARNPEPLPTGATMIDSIPFNEAVRYEIYRVPAGSR